MKKITYLLALIFVSQLSYAQEKGKADTTRIDLGTKEIIIIDSEVSEGDTIFYEDIDIDDDCDDMGDLTYWGGVDIGINVLLNADGENSFEGDDQWLDQDFGQSFHWGLNLFEKRIRIVKDYVGIVTGLGLQYNSYGFANNVVVNREVLDITSGNMIDSTWGTILEDGEREFTKNKMRTSSINIPVLLQFNTSSDNDRNFHIAGGLVGGWNYRTMVKTKFEEGGHKSMNKEKGDFNTNAFTLDATVRVGYRNFTLFGTMGLTPLFEEGKGPEVTAFRAGIMLSNF